MPEKGPVKVISEDGSTVTRVRNPNPPKITTKSVQERHLDNVAKGYILGRTHRQDQDKVRSQLEKKITSRVGAKGKLLTDKLFELINGVYIVVNEEVDPKTGKTKDVKYYKEKPSLKAIQYAMDRVLGKPTQRQEVYNENEGLKTIESIVKTIADQSHLDKKPFKGVVEVKPNEDVEGHREQDRLTATG